MEARLFYHANDNRYYMYYDNYFFYDTQDQNEAFEKFKYLVKVANMDNAIKKDIKIKEHQDLQFEKEYECIWLKSEDNK